VQVFSLALTQTLRFLGIKSSRERFGCESQLFKNNLLFFPGLSCEPLAFLFFGNTSTHNQLPACTRRSGSSLPLVNTMLVPPVSLLILKLSPMWSDNSTIKAAKLQCNFYL
jgi:hypothetical protein